MRALVGFCDGFTPVILLYQNLDKLLAVVDAADQAVNTIDKLLELTDAYIDVNISGKDYRFDVTKELRQKLADLKDEL